MQLLEIYNEQLRDLLDPSRSCRRLDIRNTERSGTNVPDAIQVCLLFARQSASLHCVQLTDLPASTGSVGWTPVAPSAAY